MKASHQMHEAAQDHMAVGAANVGTDAKTAGVQRRHPPTIRAMLVRAVVWWILPAWVCVMIGIGSFYQRERDHLAQSTVATARALAVALDRELSGTTVATQVLAGSPVLESDDFAAFHREASKVIPLVLGSNFVLSDLSGQQIVDTLLPYGTLLPIHGNMPLLRHTVATGRPAIGSVLIGSALNKPKVSIEVPVVRGGIIRYTLGVGMFSERLNELLLQQRLSENWVAAIIDASGTIAAHNRNPELHVGHKAAPLLLAAMKQGSEGVAETISVEGTQLFSAFSRSAFSDWTVAIGIPVAELSGSLNAFLLIGSAGALILLGIGLALAVYQSKQIALAVQSLIPPALALGRGEMPQIPPSSVREADDVARALERAFHLLQSRTIERDNAQEDKQQAETFAREMAQAHRQIEVANKELEEFAYAASHDLKAPLRVIENASKWLEEDLHEHLSGETRENMNLLRGRVGRMENLLDDLLEYSRIGRATDENNLGVITGDVLVSNVLALLSPPESFTVKVSPGFADIQVRRMPLQQILMNLVGNAIKHHDKERGCIEITVEEHDANYAFAVKDDGPGIPAQFHEQVFQMFQTLRPRDQVEGNGMGLAMARKHIETCGGTLTLESSEGQGSIFSFTWPKQQQLLGVAA
jgi:signal transduction histidine kinase